MPDKFEREIDEILKKIDDFPRRPTPLRRGNAWTRRVSALQRSLAIRAARISVSQVMLTAMGLMVLSYLFRAALPGVWVYGLVLGLILFFTAFGLSLRSGGTRGSQPYHRGRPRTYYETDTSSLWPRLRAWWRNQRRGRR
jgi:hypothetical protein